MAKQQIVHAAIASGLTLFILPAVAEEPSGVKLTLDVDQRFEAGDNLALENPEEGSTALSTTTLTFGLLSETRTQSLSVFLGGKLREGEIPSGSDIETGFVEPRLTFDYTREGSDSLLSVDGLYRESDISFRPAVSDFIDPVSGVIVLPPDFEDLEGSGTRQSYRLNARLETDRSAPIGFVFTAGVSGITYDQQTAALDDIFRYSTGVRTNLRFSPVTTGFASYNFRHFESDNTENTDRDTNAFEVGVAQELAIGANLEAAIGYTEIDERENGINTTTSGATGRLSLVLGRPNGTITASYTTTRNQDGARHSLNLGRSLELPNGQLSASVGATSEDGSDPALIGSIDYFQDLPTGNIKVGLSRNVAVNNDDEERVTTTADMSYNYDINELSSLGFDVTFGVAEGSGGSDDTTRADFSASYNYKLTEDWNLKTGVAYKVRDEENDGTSDSTSIFLSLNREFTFYP